MTCFHTIKVHQALDPTSKHNAGEIIISKHSRLLKTTRRKSHTGRAYLEKIMPLQNRDIMIRIPAITMCCRHYLYIIVSFNLPNQFLGQTTCNYSFRINSRVEQRATQNRILLYQQH